MIQLVVMMLMAQPMATSPLTQMAAISAPVRLAAGVKIRFVTDGAIDSRSIQQGQRFGLTVADEVLVGSQLVIPRGTRAVGEVDSVTDRGSFGRGATFVLRPLFIDLNGQRINLVGSTEAKGKSQVGAAAVTTVLVGAVGLLITGRSATLPAGSTMTGEVRNDVLLPSR
jgi:hypothetical protein